MAYRQRVALELSGRATATPIGVPRIQERDYSNPDHQWVAT